MHLTVKKSKTAKLLSILLVMVLMAGLLTIQSSAAQVYGAGQVSVSSGNLNVRSGPSASNDIVAKLGKDTPVTLLSKSGDWWHIRYSQDGYGYCSSSYISVLSTNVTSVAITSGTLNVRRGAGTEFEIKDTLFKGETVVALWSVGQWSRILYRGGTIGWVSSAYLSGATVEASTTQTYQAPKNSGPVQLQVTAYSQWDSRWRNVKLGSSKNTVGAQGCAVTSLAMVESYRTGTTVTPTDMVASLQFTSGGALYLPDYYVSDYVAGYQATYDLLKAGKPVIIAGKTKTGSQHWVVITGYTGDGTSFSASEFVINDPGVSSRTTLNQFFEDYPYFYKTVYYK